MRYINVEGYNPKSLKIVSQKKLSEMISKVSIAEKKAYLDVPDNQIWTKYKRGFERLSHNKCWFTEAYSTLSDFHIEHFRPKKKIYLIKNKDPYIEERIATDNNGYWWLSFELGNFRLAGGKPNQYKGNYFPLESGSKVAKELDNSWRNEKPMFLDPCVKEDVELITYDGVEPKESNPDINSLEHIRARISIKIYALKINKLKNARSRIFEVAKNYYNSAELNWKALNENNGVNQVAYNLAKENFDVSCSNLVLMLKPNKEFTRMVLVFLVSTNLDWIEEYIIDVAKANKFI
ncbi:HNH endonuclease family protein [Chryseobacterium luteum]|uniref:HNH nuclease domain-containing protein n=1 Tax=Chryseobacterium luteum TaxID=421531 RepID=A0A085ZHF9_9FLAO|nr:hypothetical protein [Chryseobacterium luteum]KFF03873.1 hypothetical protein IX38_10735 [Chryseobacterium luteum]